MFRYHSYQRALLFLFMILNSCQQEEQDIMHLQSILMSTGWRVENYVFHMQDQGDTYEADTLILNIIKSDASDDERAVYTNRWIIFENDTISRTAFNFNSYYRPKDSSDWITQTTNLTGEGYTEWGFDTESKPYLNIHGSRPILIEIVDENCFILKDAYLIESTQSSHSGSVTITFKFGDDPSGQLKSIDAVYRSASAQEGPPWFPPWPYW